MIRTCCHNQQYVEQGVKNGKLDMIATSQSDGFDDMLSYMNRLHYLDCFNLIEDKRAKNSSIPINKIMINAIAAKGKQKVHLKDIPIAIQDHKLLGELGVTLIDPDGGDIDSQLMSQNNLPHILGKYNINHWFKSYTSITQNHTMKKLNFNPTIHIMDSTTISVYMKNNNYEDADKGFDHKAKQYIKGYKLPLLRSQEEDSRKSFSIITEAKLCPASASDKTSCQDIFDSPMLKPGDTLLLDAGFSSRSNINYLTSERKLKVHIPLTKNMKSYKKAINIACENGRWADHPNKDRVNQKIAFVPNLGIYWKGDNPEEDVDFNACVIFDDSINEYYVIISTNTSINAREIVKKYELRSLIEEDNRQLKAVWQLEKLGSRKRCVIDFQIVTTLWAYLLFQIYKHLTNKGNISLPSLNQIKSQPFFILFCTCYFGIFSIKQYSKLLTSCAPEIQNKIFEVLEKFNLG